MLGALFWAMAILILAFIISSLPLYFAVKALGGKTTLLRTMMVTLISGIIFAAVKARFSFGWLLAFFILIWIYREFFRLRWGKAFVAWILQFIFIALFYVIVTIVLAMVIGITVLGLL
jgi:hypothetical protein